MRPGFFQYVRAAFNARPIGMFVPPNWIGLAGFGLLGFSDPGFWVLGAGLELAYLSLLSTNARFQRLVAGQLGLDKHQSSEQKLTAALEALPPADRERYRRLDWGCQSVLQLQFHGATDAPGYQMQAESLGRLTLMYLRLLTTRQAIQHIILSPGAPPPQADDPRQRKVPPPLPGQVNQPNETRQLEARLADLRERLADASLGDDLRRSLSSQADLIQQRLDRRGEAVNKLAFIEAELTRIEQQVELIREQAVLSSDPESFSHRIDEIGATLSGTADWVAEQQRALGAMDDLLAEPIAVGGSSRARVSQ